MMAEPVRTPNAYVLAGPNGAGKTTFATQFLPDYVRCREFVNADLIAVGLSPFAPETQAMRAGRLVLTRIKELAAMRQDFGFETTLAGRGHARLISGLKSNGYVVHLYFLWLPKADMAVSRVANRVRHGGHDIPEALIRRRFEAGIRNFFKIYIPLVDDWRLYDGSQMPPSLVARASDQSIQQVQPQQYEAIHAQWGTRPST
jgi:predicted ABC-type ATPase